MTILGRDKDGKVRPLKKATKPTSKSFEERGDKPVSYVVVVINKDRSQKRKNARTMTEANTIERRFKNAREDGTLRTGRSETVAAFLADWIDNVAPVQGTKKRRDSTLKRYRELLTAPESGKGNGNAPRAGTYVTREIGALRLDQVKSADVYKLYATMRAATIKGRRVFSDTTILRTHRALSLAFKHAHRDKGTRSPLSRESMDAPTAGTHEIKPPTRDEARVILAEAAKTPYGAIAFVAAHTGARQAELLDLKWSNVDLDAGTLSIIAGKTQASRRTLTLTPATLATLREHRNRQREERVKLGPIWHDSGLVFTDSHGGRIDASNLRRAWATICATVNATRAANGDPKVRWHDLRHMVATRLLELNTNVKNVSTLLGHSQIGITLNTYSHVAPEDAIDAATAARLDAMLTA